VLCFWAVCMKTRIGYDDALDVLGIHGVGGTWGALATGIVATVGAGSVVTGDFKQLWIQFVGVAAAAVYAFVVTFVLCKILDATFGLRVEDDEELLGLDQSEHGETGYSL
jgi:Amt family ammonium transporter